MLFNIIPLALIAARVAALPTGTATSGLDAHKPLHTGHGLESNHTSEHTHHHHRNHTRTHTGEHSHTGTRLLKPTASPVVVARHEHEHKHHSNHTETESHESHSKHSRTHTGTHLPKPTTSVA